MQIESPKHPTDNCQLSTVNCQLRKRLLSLDVLRGITVVGMILVNNSGGKLSYDSLQHSAWNGLTLCDLVFPFFLFIMGISTYIALSKFHFQASG